MIIPLLSGLKDTLSQSMNLDILGAYTQDAELFAFFEK